MRRSARRKRRLRGDGPRGGGSLPAVSTEAGNHPPKTAGYLRLAPARGRGRVRPTPFHDRAGNRPRRRSPLPRNRNLLPTPAPLTAPLKYPTLPIRNTYVSPLIYVTTCLTRKSSMRRGSRPGKGQGASVSDRASRRRSGFISAAVGRTVRHDRRRRPSTSFPFRLPVGHFPGKRPRKVRASRRSRSHDAVRNRSCKSNLRLNETADAGLR